MKHFFEKVLRLTTYYLLLSCTLFTACSEDFDDSAIWSELNKQADRIAKLESWQSQVNNNIASLQGLVSALQNADAITGVNSFSTPAPGGYDITFKSGTNIRILNGAKGDKGDTGEQGDKGDTGDPGDAPVIGVAEYPTGSGVYYWTLDGQWLIDNTSGNMIPVTGEKGDKGDQGDPGNDGQDGQPGQDAIAPQVRINYSTNEWEISTDGGQTWGSTYVQATGPQGPAGGPQGPQGEPGEQGPQGDSIFAENGVDNSYADYVVFTLANGSTITLPRYKTIGIGFNQPSAFAMGETKDIYYYHTGETPAEILVMDIPEGWTVTVDQSNRKLSVTAPVPGTVGVYKAFIMVSDGKDRTAIQPLHLELERRYDSQSMLLELTVTSNSTVKLPIAGVVDCVVNWGDGSASQTVTTVHPTHTYTTTGTYTITITGTATALRTHDGSSYQLTDTQRGYITAVLNWGSTGLTNMTRAFYGCTKLETIADASGSFNNVVGFMYAFYGCTSLKSVPAGFFSGCTEATSFIYAFYGCSLLKTVGDNLFSGCISAGDFKYVFQNCTSLLTVGNNLFGGCTSAMDFRYAFQDCTSLTTLPASLFSGATAATDFRYVFDGCYSLLSLPDGLFGNCPEVLTFSYAFYGCSSLMLLPADLFSSCTKVTDFSYAFRSCTSLMSIPASLFDNNKSVDYFDHCFYNCVSLGGESPYTVVDGVKVYLWQRSSANGFTAPTIPAYSTNRCFYYCTGLTDYASIPSSWR